MADERTIRAGRLARLRQQMRVADLPVLLLTDPINLRYATGSRNMQVWTLHNLCRYALIAADGPLVLYELPSSAHLSRGLETIDEIRPSLAWDYVAVGPRGEEMARRLAAELADFVAQHGGGRLAIDRADLPLTEALAALNVRAVDGKGLMERTRAIKSPAEIESFVASLRTTEAAIGELKAALRPGLTEQEAFAILLAGSIKRGGEYPETRLLTAGPRTNPWFQESSDRPMQAGELVSFDTDLIGPGGWYTDLSRSFLVGEGKPSDAQRRLYDLARRQIEHNVALLRPGESFLALTEKAFRLPDDCVANRYADIAHGCGLAVEYPLIWYAEDAAWGAYDGLLEPGMVVCVESYVGAVGGREGVKLEEPVLITETGARVLSSYPLEDGWS
ncbi:MAG TPA: Xaa-Pro peptidase family protein [Kiloniellales bacterium]|nr:Xaa-Pro peptidase family protein [Kiloniellales bacterium]